MRTALREVQKELGPEAVILSTQSARDRVTVIAALDYDAALMPPAADSLSNAPPATAPAMGESPAYTLSRPSGSAQSPSLQRSVGSVDELVQADIPVAQPVSDELAAEPALVARGDDTGVARLEREITYLHRMLAEHLPHLGLTASVEAARPSALHDIGVDAALSERIQALTMTKDGPAPDSELLAELTRRVPVTLPKGAKVQAIALVGPTGAGKTTTAAKLAARHLMRFPGSNVRFVCTDTYRIGAREQLQTFARLLGTTVEMADDPEILRALIQTENSTDLVIVDTPGIGPRDAELASQLPILGDMDGLHVALCLPASLHPVELRRVIDRYAGAKPDGLVLTKVDESHQFGPALSVAIERTMPILWISDGQRVPQDLHRLDAKSLVARALANRDADGPMDAAQNTEVAYAQA